VNFPLVYEQVVGVHGAEPMCAAGCTAFGEALVPVHVLAPSAEAAKGVSRPSIEAVGMVSTIFASWIEAGSIRAAPQWRTITAISTGATLQPAAPAGFCTMSGAVTSEEDRPSSTKVEDGDRG
jgi:hypothetical protein